MVVRAALAAAILMGVFGCGFVLGALGALMDDTAADVGGDDVD